MSLSEDAIVYILPPSPYNKKVMAALNYHDLHPRVVEVNPFNPEERAAFLQKVPMGKLPTLIDSGQQVCESSLIVEYLDSVSGRSPLVPREKGASLAVRQWDAQIDNYLTAPLLAMFFEQMEEGAVRQSGRRAEFRAYRLQTLYRQINEQLVRQQQSESPWLLGDGMTLADVALLSALPTAELLAPFADFAALQAYRDGHRGLEWFVDAEARGQTYFPGFVESIQRAAA